MMLLILNKLALAFNRGGIFLKKQSEFKKEKKSSLQMTICRSAVIKYIQIYNIFSLPAGHSDSTVQTQAM